MTYRSRYDEPDLRIIKREPPLVLNSGRKVIGTLVEFETTRDRYSEMPHGVGAGYMMIPEPPPGYPIDCNGPWRIYDSSGEHKTVWCRDCFLIVEKLS